MSDFTLVIGNKNYSSWSLRPWLLLQHLQLPFEELQIPLAQPDSRARMLEQSPAGRVPVLKHGALTIWESLAIMEYLCEIAGAGLPRDRTARAHARAISAEMHAGFGVLRAQWPFNARASGRRTPMTPELRADIERVQALWADCRARFGGSGAWLFGEYSLADAMFAPVVLRFRTYGATLAPPAQAYVATTLQDAPLLNWLADAAAEPWRIDYTEIGDTR